MARRRPLRTHLLARHAPRELKTVCGMTATVRVMDPSFPPPEHGLVYEGIVPDSLGVGIVVAPSSRFAPQFAPGGLCGGCLQRYGTGAGI